MRDAVRDDLGAIVAIYNHYVRNSWVTFETEPVSVEGRRAWFDGHARKGRYRLLVATDGAGGVLGWTSSGPFRPRSGYVSTVESSVYCDPRRTGRGVGSRLYATLLRELEGEEVERVVAAVALPNPASLALHRAFGFRPVGVFSRVGRKFGHYWDVAWFERPGRPVPASDGSGSDHGASII